MQATTTRYDNEPRSLLALRGRLRGDLVEPGHADYEDRRKVFQAAADGHPAAIVMAADPADVIRAVAFARESGIQLAVRSGGHSVPGHSTGDGVLVVDLSPMKGLQIDAARRIGWAESGLTAGEYTAAAHTAGLATPFGDTSTVGIAGLTLGGGIGYLVRKHGLAVDNLLSVEMVTADGRLVVADAEENADLFWAVRGGGGNFGVVTRFEYRLHEVGAVYGGGLFLPATRNVLRGFGPLEAEAPDGLSTITTIMAAPPAPFIPAAERGKLVAGIVGVHAGESDAGERAWAPLRGLARPVADLVGPMPYPAIYEYTKEAAQRHVTFVRSMFLDAITDDIVDAILEFMPRATSPAAMTQIRVLGGEMARVPAEATAFAHRRKQAMLSLIVPFVGPAAQEQHQAWSEEYWAALERHGSGAYVNFLADEGDERISEAYPGDTYSRLARVKAKYDPDNVFRMNQNVRPASSQPVA